MTGRFPVLLVHNRYRESGGEDAVFAAEARLLREYGHDVHELLFDNHDIPADPGLAAKLRLGAAAIWSREAARRVAAAVNDHRAAIAHFHNTFPLISPAAYGAARDAGAAVVQTLHNYRLLCPGALMYREGRPCESCLGRTFALPAIRHGCYQQSRPHSAVTAAMLATHRLRGTWRRDVDAFIALTQFARDRHIAGGLPAARIAVKPNFVASPPPPTDTHRSGVLFVGRLVESKGVETLLEAWKSMPPGHVLSVAGDGPVRPAVEAAAGPSIRMLGRLSPDDVRTAMERAAALVVPSTWYEAFPVTVLEAYAAGLPVVASRLGSLAEVVLDGETGRLFAPGDPTDLSSTLASALADRRALAGMGLASRLLYEARYTPEANYRELMSVYEQALRRRQRHLAPA
jgi:glycosyltransferase involved in cell wall biosynthesis